MSKYFLICIFSCLLLLSCSETSQNIENGTGVSVFENIDDNKQIVTIDASKDHVLTMDDGVVMVIPPNILVDKEGRAVKGKVKLDYTSYNSAGAILASGIPMTVKDQTGREQQLESAGMFDLRASVNGEEVFVKKGKEIQVTVPSAAEGDYDLYYFDESNTSTSQNTNGISPVVPSMALAGSTRKIKGRWEKIKTATKEKIATIKKGKEFKLNWDSSSDRMKAAAKLKWQYGEVNPDLNPFSEKNKWVLDHTWNSIKISQPKYYAIKQGEFKYNTVNGFRYLGYKNGKEVFQTRYPTSIYFFDTKAKEMTSQEGWMEKTGFWTRSPDEFYGTDSQRDNFLKAQKCFVIGENYSKSLYDANFNKIKDLGNATNFRYFFDKDELVYSADVNGGEGVVLRAIRPDGSLIREKHLPHSGVRISKDGRYFCVYSEDVYTIYNSGDFSLKAEKKIETEGYVYLMFGGEHGLWINTTERIGRDRKIEMKFWSWEQDLVIDSPFKHDWRDIELNPFTGTLLIKEEKSKERKEWDWRTRDFTGKSYTAYINPHIYPGGEVSMIWSNYGSRSEVFNRQGKNPFYCSHQGTCYSQISNFSGDRFVNIANDSVQLYDKFGEKMKAFGYMYSASSVRWDDDNALLVRYVDGSQGSYDKDGCVRSFVVGTIPVSTGFSHEGIFGLPISDKYSWIPVYERNGPYGNQVYDPNGDVILDLSGYGAVATFGFNDREFRTVDGEGVMWFTRTDEVKDTSLFKITLISKDSVFVTSVHLTPEKLEALGQVVNERSWKQKRDQKQKKKQMDVMRSFSINKFGIYNYDRYYEDDLIKCKAEFELTRGEFPADATVFLITGEKGRAVVKFWSGTWDRFYFSANYDNQLLVVLPGDKIAVFDKKQFQELNKKKIRKEGKFKFKLKVLSKLKSVKELDEILNRK